MMNRLRVWRKRRALHCRVDEEWCGVFIGRRWCATHEVYWDNGGPCLKREDTA